MHARARTDTYGDAGATQRALDEGGEVVEEPLGVVVAALADDAADVVADDEGGGLPDVHDGEMACVVCGGEVV